MENEMSTQKPRSLQDILKRRQQEEFVGREEQLAFHQVHADEAESLVEAVQAFARRLVTEKQQATDDDQP